MSEQSIRNLEKKVFLSYHDDGLLECFIGLVILAFAAGMVFESLYYIGSIMPAIGLPPGAEPRSAGRFRQERHLQPVRDRQR